MTDTMCDLPEEELAEYVRWVEAAEARAAARLARRSAGDGIARERPPAEPAVA
jgi:hypothetical protein